MLLPVVLAGFLAAGCVTPLAHGTKNLVWNCQNAEKTVTVGYAVNHVAHSNNAYTVNELEGLGLRWRRRRFDPAHRWRRRAHGARE